MDIKGRLLQLVKGKSTEAASPEPASASEKIVEFQEQRGPDAPVTLRDVQGVILTVMDVLDERKKREQKTSRRKWLALAVIVTVLGFLVFGEWGGPPAQVEMTQKTPSVIPLTGEKGVAHIAVIPIDGDIDGDELGRPGFDNTTLYIRTALELAAEQKNLAAVIFYINSNGGDAVASAQGHRLIKRFRETTKLPVIAFVSSHAFSGGYYLALGAERIIVDPVANVGSVGVIMKYFNTATLGKAFGVGDIEIATGPLKVCIGQWKELSTPCRKMLQRSVDATFEGFLEAMSESRRIPLDTLMRESKLDDGRTNGGIFSAKDAVANNMADAAMTRNELYLQVAKDIAQKYPNLKSVEFVEYNKKPGLLRELTGEAKKTLRSASRFMDAVLGVSAPRMELRAE